MARSRPRLVPRTRPAAPGMSGGAAPERAHPGEAGAVEGGIGQRPELRELPVGEPGRARTAAAPRWMRHSIAWTPSSSEPVKPISRHSSASGRVDAMPATSSERATSKPTTPFRRRASASRSAGVRRAGRAGAGSEVGRSRMASATVRATNPMIDGDPSRRQPRRAATGRAEPVAPGSAGGPRLPVTRARGPPPARGPVAPPPHPPRAPATRQGPSAARRPPPRAPGPARSSARSPRPGTARAGPRSRSRPPARRSRSPRRARRAARPRAARTPASRPAIGRPRGAGAGAGPGSAPTGTDPVGIVAARAARRPAAPVRARRPRRTRARGARARPAPRRAPRAAPPRRPR